MYRALVSFVGLLVLFTSLNAAADGGDRLKFLLDKMSAYSAVFDQTTMDGKGFQSQKGKGEFVLKQPGQFRWMVKEPFPQTIVSDGKSVWVYDPDLEQVSIDYLDERASKTPAVLLTGSTEEIRKHYRISASRDSLKETFVLTPKDEGSLFTLLSMNFVDEQLVEMQIEDSLGQYTKIVFTHVQINPELASDAFSVTYPDYVDVLDNRAQAQ
ncbi:outer membrane lipoprotein chaperone LolA [Litoribacillus peritrichatus]|uniref:Outer-membrane lipoprotein carrier protein n=1 Tax=Litoribacillus peritrichatus TaxID=718191 RepID=A0ABP7N162_9GAMM